MRIPSYDDLTPSIPDITPRETLTRVEGMLTTRERTREQIREQKFVQTDGAAGAGTSAQLFACLRSTCPPGVMMAIAREFSPRLERHGSCVVLDVSGLGRLLGDAHAIGAELARAAADRTAAERGSAAGIRVAVAPTQTAARLMTVVHPRLMVLQSDVAPALAHLPIGALRSLMDDDGSGPGGVAAKAAARAKATAGRLDTFRRWGLTTLGEVAALPAAELSERMGQEGLLLQRLARGLDSAPLIPDPAVPRFIQSIELEWPIDALEPLSFVLARLLDPLSDALERADRGAAALRLDLRLVTRTRHTRVLQLPAAMRDPKVLRTLLLLDLESHPPTAAIDIVTIEVDPAPARILQYSLLERAMPSAETLATLTARLGALVGEHRCGSPALLDTHRPDGFEMRRFAPDARRTPGTQSPLEPRQPGPPLSLRRFRPPIAIRVTFERGRPMQVAIDRRGMPGGQVEQQAGPWRTSGAWWDAAATAWDRDEWDVALSDGSFCRIFRDRVTGRWFLEGVLD
jgi:protein ImuB